MRQITCREGKPMNLRSTVVLAGAALVAGMLPAAAVASDRSPAPTTRLVISVKEQGEKRLVANLRCHPPIGDHPNRSSACAEIESAGGDFTKLPGRQTFAACPKIYRPVRARANGLAEGRSVDYDRTFPNRCELGVATGSVFEIWPQN
jgi:hypothetical protein